MLEKRVSTTSPKRIDLLQTRYSNCWKFVFSKLEVFIAAIFFFFCFSAELKFILSFRQSTSRMNEEKTSSPDQIWKLLFNFFCWLFLLLREWKETNGMKQARHAKNKVSFFLCFLPFWVRLYIRDIIRVCVCVCEWVNVWMCIESEREKEKGKRERKYFISFSSTHFPLSFFFSINLSFLFGTLHSYSFFLFESPTQKHSHSLTLSLWHTFTHTLFGVVHRTSVANPHSSRERRKTHILAYVAAVLHTLTHTNTHTHTLFYKHTIHRSQAPHQPCLLASTVRSKSRFCSSRLLFSFCYDVDYESVFSRWQIVYELISKVLFWISEKIR